MRIAVLDDDPVQLEFLVQLLTRQLDIDDEIVACSPYPSGSALRRAMRHETYDLLLLDWNVQDLDRDELMHWLRQVARNDVPVIATSAEGSERDLADAFALGVDDYIVKPVRPFELCARIHRSLRRRNPSASNPIEHFGDWSFDRPRLSMRFRSPDGTPQRMVLTEREFRLALAFFRHLGRAVSRTYLLEALGMQDDEMPSRALDSHIYRLRAKLSLHSASGLRLQTVYGQGYRLARTEPAAAPDLQYIQVPTVAHKAEDGEAVDERSLCYAI